MKKILFILILMVCNAFLAFSQSAVYSYQFSYHDVGEPPCYIANDPQWKIFHGSPCYYDYYEQGNYNVLRLRENVSKKSEGIFTNFNFSKNKKYRFAIASRALAGKPAIFLFAANNLSEHIDPNCELGYFPSGIDSKEIDWNYADCSTQGGFCDKNFPHQDNSYWIPDKDYKQLLISSDPDGPAATLLISSVHIYVYEGDKDTESPTTPGNLHTTVIEPTSISVEWTRSTDNVGVAGYEVYCNNALIGTTTNTQYTIPNRTPCINYEIAVRAFDAANNFSPKTSINVQTPLPADLVLQSPINLSSQPNKKYIAEASNSIRLTPGFSVKANDVTELFQAKISADCNSMLLNAPSSNGEEPYFTGEEGNIFYALSILPANTDDEIHIYPNPTSSIVTIEYPQFTGMEKIIMFDIAGKQILNSTLSGNLSTIDISSFSAGIFFIKIIAQEKVFVKKLIKM